MKRAIAALLLLLLPLGISALEVEEGRIRLTLDEHTSRFTIDYKDNRGDWVPLFVSDDPRTSAIEVLEGNQIHRIGDSGEFRQSAVYREGTATFLFTSSTLEIEQLFEFVISVGSDAVDGVQMTLSVTNLGERRQTVGARYLFDTYLGERDNTHFLLPTQERLINEIDLVESLANTYVASPSGESPSVGFQYMLAGNQITEPESAVVANLKRLTDSIWEYEANGDRNFNRLPFSVNDSALLVTYLQAELETGETYQVVSQFGNIAPDGYHPVGTVVVPPQVAQEAIAHGPAVEETPIVEETSPAEEADVRRELVLELLAILEDIDGLLAKDEIVLEDVRAVGQRLQDLTAKVLASRN